MIMTGQSCWQLRSVPDCVLTDGAVAASLQGHSLLYLIFSCEHMCRSHSGWCFLYVKTRLESGLLLSVRLDIEGACESGW